MPNLAHALPDTPTSVFDGDWISRLDAIGKDSFFKEADEAFLIKFSSHAEENDVNGYDISNVTDTVFKFMQKKGLTPLDIQYWHNDIDGSVSVWFAIDKPPEVCLDHYEKMVHEIVTSHDDFLSYLITFSLISYADQYHAVQAS